MTRHIAARKGEFTYRTVLRPAGDVEGKAGHVSNVDYYQYFDTAARRFLVEALGIDLKTAQAIPFAKENLCRFLKPLIWGQEVCAGLRVEHIGKTSIKCGMALFGDGGEVAAADGHWVYVFITRDERKPTPIPESVRVVVEEYAVPEILHVQVA